MKRWSFLIISFLIFLLTMGAASNKIHFNSNLITIYIVLLSLFCLITYDYLKKYINRTFFYNFVLLSLFSCYIFIDDAFFDMMVVFILVFILPADIIYNLIYLVKCIKNKNSFSYKHFYSSLLLVLLLSVLFYIGNKDANSIRNQIIQTCKTSNDCKESSSSYEVSYRFTTLLLRNKIDNGCIKITSYFAFPRMQEIKICNQSDAKSSLKKDALDEVSQIKP